MRHNPAPNPAPPPLTSGVRTPDEVRAELARNGLSIRQWAAAHNVSPGLVYDLLSLNPRRKCIRGQSHRVAVLLGLKRGALPSSASAINVVPDHSPPRRAAARAANPRVSHAITPKGPAL